MLKKKTLQELTIKDNFMFGAVMTNEENCRKFLEMVLGFPIERVEVVREKSLVYHPENKGVRLDVYAKDKKNKHYNVEMQVARKPELEKRVRYYHGQIDMEMLFCGQDYRELSDAYVIFICDFDPFQKGKYCYTFENRCLEVDDLSLNEGSKSIFLNTHGENDAEVSKALVQFLKYVKADLTESGKDFDDAFVKQIQKSIQYVKNNRRMEERYMLFEELLRDEYAEGKAEGKVEGKAESVLELLEDCGEIPEEWRERIMSERNLDVLRRWHKLAAKVDTVQQFIRKIESWGYDCRIPDRGV